MNLVNLLSFSFAIGSLPLGMTRKTLFSQLPYYEDLPIVHMFDTMHIGKNVSSCLYNILFEKSSTHGKPLNKLQVRMDLKEAGIMPHLWPYDDGNFVDDPWSLTKEGKGHMIKSIKSVRFPTGFGVNFKKAFMKGNELAGMKPMIGTISLGCVCAQWLKLSILYITCL